MENRFEDHIKKNIDYLDTGFEGKWKNIFSDIFRAYDVLTPTKEYFFMDPLLKITRIAKRNLLISSCLLILIITYGITASDPKIFGLGLGSKEKYILTGVFALVLAHQLISFVFHYVRDISTMLSVHNAIAHETLVYPLLMIHHQMSRYERAKELGDNSVKGWENLCGFFKNLDRNYLKIKALTSAQYLRFYLEIVVWDFIIPVGLAIIALWLSSSQMVHVLKDVFAKLFF